MRWIVALILFISILFSGCSSADGTIDTAVSLRNKLQESNGCSFSATVNADYGDKIYKFSMDCTSDKEGNLSFVVTKPDTISGITGRISAQGGGITFDDKILAFQTLADGEISPVTAPWVFLNSLRGGYIRGCAYSDGSYQIEIDDTYEEDALRLNIWVVNNLPVNGEIFWKGRRAIAFTVDGFVYL